MGLTIGSEDEGPALVDTLRGLPGSLRLLGTLVGQQSVADGIGAR